MTNPAEQQPSFSLFGQSLAAPVADVELLIALKTVMDVAEMNRTGFDTASLFNPDDLNPLVGSDKGLLKLTSLRTRVEYLVDLQVCLNGRYYATVQICNPASALYKMTLVRADNGTIRMDIGWHVPTTA